MGAYVAYEVRLGRMLMPVSRIGEPAFDALLRSPAIVRDQQYDGYGVTAFGGLWVSLGLLLVVGSHWVLLPPRRIRPRVSRPFLEGLSYREPPPSVEVVTNADAIARRELAGVAAVALSLAVGW